jgi:hypothetical protein
VAKKPLSEKTKQQLGIGGRIFMTLFLSVFLSAGLFFFGLLALDLYGIAVTYTWPARACTILSSQTLVRKNAPRNEPAYAFHVKYRYEVDGKTYTSATYRKDYKGDDDYGRADRRTRRYPVGERRRCYADPADPQTAMLARQTFWQAFFLLLPTVFILVGGGGIYAVWAYRAGKKDEDGDGVEDGKSISEKGRKSRPWGPMILFAVFFLAGMGFLIPIGILPLCRVLLATGWQETPCVVLHSRVQAHEGDESTNYSIDILFEYEIDEQTYRSSRYSFFTVSGSGRKSKKNVVKQYPPGKEAVCYVNPSEPTDAVIHRGFTWSMLLALIPVPFVAIGLGGMFYTYRYLKKDATPEKALEWRPKSTGIPYREHAASGYDRPDLPDGAVVFRRPWKGIGRFFGLLAVCLFWNGIVSVFVHQAIAHSSGISIFLAIFLIPFVVVGLCIAAGVLWAFLAIFNPRVVVTLSSASVPLGGSVKMEWQIKGRAHAFRRWRVYLEGREEATYRRGTDTITDKEAFATIPIYETENPWDMANGCETISVPPDTMHSFESGNNKILWQICVRGDIPWWPDVEEDYTLVVSPPPAGGEGTA